MKKSLIFTLLISLCPFLVFASGVDGEWTATIDTENGPFTFTVFYQVDGENISGKFSSEWGERYFSNGKISGEEFEYSYKVSGHQIVHKGKLVDNEIIVKWTSTDLGGGEFTLRRVT